LTLSLYIFFHSPSDDAILTRWQAKKGEHHETSQIGNYPDDSRRRSVMAELQRTKVVRAGDWRTLESGWNTQFSCRFLNPVGAQIKIRYGNGSFLGRDSQKQTLDGVKLKVVHVGGGSVVYARVQMKVPHDTEVTYTYIATGP
jgi:hypothetical protein